jgi:hypothetical protein
MMISFDNGTPNTLSRSLIGHEVAFARKIGWTRILVLSRQTEFHLVK